MNYLLGIDVGTSATKTVLFDEKGTVIASASQEYPLYQPENGWAEQKPEDWRDAVLKTIKEVVSQSGVDKDAVKGIGISGQMHGLVMLDEAGEVIRPSIIWCDQRTGAEVEDMLKIMPREEWIRITANPPLTGWTAAKILWVRKNEPENYNRCRHILLPKDYIRYILTGVFATEVSDASGMQLLDVPGRCWSDEVLKALNIDKNLLGKVHESCEATGTLLPDVAKELGLSEKCIVAGGAGDNAAAAVGTGVVKDGTAFTKFMYWLKNNVGKEKITEMDTAEKIYNLRKEQEGFIETSFDTISAYGSNAAMMHYTASENSNSLLLPKNLFLIDSGGQYFEGTTDITRTIALGEVEKEMKIHYTAVLKSLIALSNTKFLYGTKGYNFDAIARKPIWELGLDYRCATGHGVGYLLNVHEGPNIFRMSAPFVMEENMITTVEPGIYIENSHGIRTENEILSRNTFKNEYGQFMEFVPVTFAPIDIDPIEVSMLSQEEKNYLNNYHKLVFEKISPFLNSEEKEWLKIYTREI